MSNLNPFHAPARDQHSLLPWLCIGGLWALAMLALDLTVRLSH